MNAYRLFLLIFIYCLFAGFMCVSESFASEAVRGIKDSHTSSRIPSAPLTHRFDENNVTQALATPNLSRRMTGMIGMTVVLSES